MSAMATSMMKKTMDKLDIPPVPEFIEMIADAGCKLYACKATVDMFKLKKEDFCPQVDSIINVGKFYEIAAGGHIIFTLIDPILLCRARRVRRRCARPWPGASRRP